MRAVRAGTVVSLVLLCAGAAGNEGRGSTAAGGVGADSASPDRTPADHDLHVVYGDFGVEGQVMAGRLRFFKDDLERSLGRLLGADAVALAPGAEGEAMVLRYLRDRLRIAVDGTALEPEVMGSGEDEMDREPAFYILLRYRAGGDIRELTVRNTLLFELHEDQRNVFKIIRFPEESPQEVYFIRGEAERRIRLQG